MTDGTIIAIVGVAVTAGLGLAGGTWAAVRTSWNLRAWLADEFSTTRKIFFDAMDAHEALDQKRHEDNLDRFSDIRAALASRGIMNGGERTDRH